MIYQHINGLRPISPEAAKAYAKGFNCSIEEISPSVAETLKVSPDTPIGRASDNVIPVGTQDTVPLISWVAAGTWTPMSDQSSEYKQVLCPFPHGKGTFALEVHGISMENPDLKPSFSEGDWIYVDPTREAHHRDFVIVRLDDSNEATFKQLLIEGSQKMLFALNKDWKPRILPINGNATIIGVVIGKVEKW